MTRDYTALLEARWEAGTAVCVGLDSDFALLPERFKALGVRDGVTAFNRCIVEATHDLVCAYKPNAAFYEAYGVDGAAALHETVRMINEIAPEVPVILDAKRADIGNTNNGYVAAAFEQLGADAVTVHPYLGREALQPFLDRQDKGIIVLCRTSNEGSGEFQSLEVGGVPLYEVVARHVAEGWDQNRNCGIVVGATYPEELGRVRSIVGEMPILIPGVGAQGGDVARTVAAGRDARGRGMIISSSRGIIFASSGEDCGEAARLRTQELRESIANAV